MRTLQINGIVYKPVAVRQQISPAVQLAKFLGNRGYVVQKQESTTYTRKKDGKIVNAVKMFFSNGGEYLVTQNRFWRIN